MLISSNGQKRSSKNKGRKRKEKKKRHGRGSPHKERVKKAQEILNAGEVLFLGHNRFKVPSQSQPEKYYKVAFLDVWTCTCPYHLNGHGDCKHIIAVNMCVVGAPAEITPKPFTIKKPEVQCPAPDCVFYEMRPTQFGWSVRYRCKKSGCGKRFTYRPFFLGLHYPNDIVTDALEDVMGGKSLEKTSLGIKKRSFTRLKRKIDRSTIYRWAVRAQKVTKDLAHKVPIQVSSHWNTDELELKSKKEKLFLFGVMDSVSRFMITHLFSRTKFQFDATDMFNTAIDVAGVISDVTTSDKLTGFETGHKNSMRKRHRECDNGLVSAPMHIRSVTLGNRHIHNNLYESQNSQFRSQAKIARGFASEEPARMGLHMTYHNFLRPHSAHKGKTPAEVMGITILGPDKWATLLEYAAST